MWSITDSIVMMMTIRWYLKKTFWRYSENCWSIDDDDDEADDIVVDIVGIDIEVMMRKRIIITCIDDIQRKMLWFYSVENDLVCIPLSRGYSDDWYYYWSDIDDDNYYSTGRYWWYSVIWWNYYC